MKDRLSLSKNLLQMKFMQRTKENVEKQKNEEAMQNSNVVNQELLDMCKKENDRYLITNSFSFCENLIYGRMSFKGMNPEIEKLMESKRSNPEATKRPREEETTADVSANEIVSMFHHKKRRHHKNRQK